MDINLPGMSGVECVARLKESLPQSLVLMLTTYEESDLIFASLRAGASGYLLKNMHPAELTQAVEQVHSGGAPMSMQIARKVVNHFQQIKQPASEMEKLTKRELEILTLLAKGYLYKEIGEHLGITSEHRARASAHDLRKTSRAIAHTGGFEISGSVKGRIAYSVLREFVRERPQKFTQHGTRYT